MALAREEFDRIGGFDPAGFPRTAEDRDLCDRALAAGLELRRAPAAVVDHHHDLDAVRLWGQHRAYGRGALAFQRSRARRGLPALTVAPRFYVALAAAPFSRTRGAGAVWLAALVATTQIAYLTGYAAEWRQTRRSAP
jgi:GT2 family glycosyltransferase